MERGRTQHHRELKTNVEFWRDHLNRFQFVVNIHDYWQLLDHVHRFLGLSEPGVEQAGIRVLDAGCGNGHFGMFLKVNQEYRALKGDEKVSLIRYTGLDFVPGGLAEAKRALEEEQQVAAGTLLDASFVCSDLNAPLPFGNEQFDRVVCNLVVGYLDNPSFTISEFLRVLSPGGRLILTNLKPNADMSQIYRNFQGQTENVHDVEEARELLNDSADIRQAETEGVFRFFGRQEFAMLLLSSGAEDVRIFKTFADQAYIAVAHKSGLESLTSKVPPADASISESAGVRAHI
jgi:SAM-dependent methyltransferase